MKVKTYKTVFGKTPEELDRFIKLEIERGFEPYGTPYVLAKEIPQAGEAPLVICQAMVEPK